VKAGDVSFLYFSNPKQKRMMAAGTIKNLKCSIIRHIFRDNFEFTNGRITPFRGQYWALLKAKMIRKVNREMISQVEACQGKSISAQARPTNTTKEMFRT
jgi:hypothetical protein